MEGFLLILGGFLAVILIWALNQWCKPEKQVKVRTPFDPGNAEQPTEAEVRALAQRALLDTDSSAVRDQLRANSLVQPRKPFEVEAEEKDYVPRTELDLQKYPTTELVEGAEFLGAGARTVLLPWSHGNGRMSSMNVEHVMIRLPNQEVIELVAKMPRGFYILPGNKVLLQRRVVRNSHFPPREEYEIVACQPLKEDSLALLETIRMAYEEGYANGTPEGFMRTKPANTSWLESNSLKNLKVELKALVNPVE